MHWFKHAHLFHHVKHSKYFGTQLCWLNVETIWRSWSSAPLFPQCTGMWSNRFCAVASTGCFALWCFPCFACITARDHGECLCLPLLESFGCIPPITMAMRVSVRNTYGIEVSKWSPSITWHIYIYTFSNWQLFRKNITKFPKSELNVMLVLLCFTVLIMTLFVFLQDSLCNDCVYACCCGPCTWCQIRRELKARQHPVTLFHNRAK